jgi:hypothetical protein
MTPDQADRYRRLQTRELDTLREIRNHGPDPKRYVENLIGWTLGRKSGTTTEGLSVCHDCASRIQGRGMGTGGMFGKPIYDGAKGYAPDCALCAEPLDQGAGAPATIGEPQQ